MKAFSVTFERYHPHAEGEDICEPDETGYLIECATLRDCVPEVAYGFSDPQFTRASEVSRDADGRIRHLDFMQYNDCTVENLQDGIDENRTLHIPKSVTVSSSRRIARLFGVNV